MEIVLVVERIGPKTELPFVAGGISDGVALNIAYGTVFRHTAHTYHILEAMSRDVIDIMIVTLVGEHIYSLIACTHGKVYHICIGISSHCIWILLRGTYRMSRYEHTVDHTSCHISEYRLVLSRIIYGDATYARLLCHGYERSAIVTALSTIYFKYGTLATRNTGHIGSTSEFYARGY